MMNRLVHTLKAITCLAALFATPLFAQEFRGTIAGVVSDQQGSAVPGAKVSVTEANTGTKVSVSSNSAGEYNAPLLLPGEYQVAVEMQGFKSFVRKGVNLGSGERVVIDVPLQIGEVTTSVEVSEDAPLLNTDSSSLGQAIRTKEVEDLPLNGRTPMVAASLSLGVIGYAQPTLIHPFDAGAASGWSVGGAYQQTSELLINGSPNATWDGRLAYSPPQDAVQEVRVKASDTDAAFGHTAGGTLNQVTKSGTNALHGSLWEFNQPNTLTANDFFLNQAGKPRPVTHLNQYGLTAGGPAVLPKFNGRNKVFWFFAFEGMKDAQPNPFTTTVPTDGERKGDFSQILTADKTILYDPYSAVVSGTTITRTPFPNNQIPQTSKYVSPAAQAYLKLFPLANVTPLRADGLQNYTVAPNTPDNYSNELGRLDINAGSKHRMFFDVRHTDYIQTKNNYFNNIATGSSLFRLNTGVSLDDVYLINASNVINLRLNFTRLNEGHDVPSAGFDATSLGLPSYINANSKYQALPVLTFASSSFQTLGNTGTGADRLPSQSGQIYLTYTTIHGNHTIKTGTDLRQYRLNTFTAGNSSGTFSFSANSYVRQSSTASSTTAFGQDLASFYMGLPTSGSYDINTFGSWYSYYGAGFVQDDWRVKRNLTLNLGIRFDRDGSYNEKYGRTVNGFDTTTVSPLSAAATAAYAKSPIPQLPASAFQVVGGLSFPKGTAVYDSTSHLVSPRFGFAWTPERLKGRTVFRGSFGMFVSPVTIARMDVNGKFSTTPNTNQQGFSQTTSMVPSNNNFASPAATLDSPYPGGFLSASGASAGLLTFAGQNVTFMSPQMKNPYSLRWTFGFQHALTNNLKLEAVYIGNHSLHLPINFTQLNGIPQKFLSTLTVRDANQAYLTGTAANPFLGLQTSTGTSASTNAAQLLARFPQFPVGDSATGWNGSGGVLEQNRSVGSSYFNSFNMQIQERATRGLTFTLNYIYSKLIERMTWLNASDPLPEKRISSIDHPHRVVLSANYDLPVGKGRPFAIRSRAIDSVVGGWSLNTVYTYQVGAPINWNNGSTTSPGDYVYSGAPIVLNNRLADPGSTAFNIAAFDTRAANAFNYHLRTFPTMIAALRQDGINQFDTSLLKKVTLTEKSYVQIRFEAFNTMNHPVFPAPNTTANNALFGTISGAQANRPRSAQIGLRVVF